MEPRQVFGFKPGERDRPRDFLFCPRCGKKLAPGRGRADPFRCAFCGFVKYENPYPGVVVLVQDEDRVLLCRRGPQSFEPGKWCLPGGFMEWDEDFLTTGIRETREETGLEIRIEAVLSVVSNALAPHLHTLVVVLLGRVTGGRMTAGDDAVEVRWAPLSGPLPEMAFEADGHIIRRYFETRLAGAPVDPRYDGARSAGTEG
jgi:8-oxo-dGTP diphosphatase